MDCFLNLNAIIVPAPTQSSPLQLIGPTVEPPPSISVSELQDPVNLAGLQDTAKNYLLKVNESVSSTTDDVSAAERYLAAVDEALTFSHTFVGQVLHNLVLANHKLTVELMRTKTHAAQAYNASAYYPNHALIPPHCLPVVTPDGSVQPTASVPVIAPTSVMELEGISRDHLTQLEDYYSLDHAGDHSSRLARMRGVYGVRYGLERKRSRDEEEEEEEEVMEEVQEQEVTETK